MSNIQEGLIAITNEILNDIMKEAEMTIQNAEKKSEEILQEAIDEAERTHKRLLADAKLKGEREKKKIQSLIEMTIQTKLLQLKEDSVNLVFDKVTSHLKEFVKSSEYHNYLIQLIQEAVQQIGLDKLSVYVNSQDKKWLKSHELDRLAGKIGVDLSLAKDTINCLGGCIVNTPDNKISYDNTLDKRLDQIKPAIRGKVAKILFNEGD